MRYKRPDIGNNSVAYKGRRYWLVQISEGGEFGGFKRNECDYVLYDCYLEMNIATADDVDGGTYSGEIIAHVDCGRDEFSSVREAAKGLIAGAEWYSRMVD